MPKIIHFQTEIKLDINISESNISDETQKLITDTIKNIWQDTYLAEYDYEDYIDIATDLWLRYYILSDITKEAVKKIKESIPPSELKIYLVFNLFDDQDNLKIDVSEIEKTPLFRAYLPTKDLWDTYTFTQNKFQSLEIIEPAYIEEIKLSLNDKQKEDLDNIILKSYEFHQRLLGKKSKKILLYTSQPEKIINDWNKTGYIPTGTYFTDNMSRAQYYWEEGDVIVDYRLPEDKVVVSNEFGGAKEYVTIDNIIIR